MLCARRDNSIRAARIMTESNSDLARAIEASNRELGEKLEAMNNANIKSKDRVDITLAEYNAIRGELEMLRARDDILNAIGLGFISEFGTSINDLELTGPIEYMSCDDPMRLETAYRITFRTRKTK